MEYINYLLIVLGLFLAFLYGLRKIRLLRLRGDKPVIYGRAKRRRDLARAPVGNARSSNRPMHQQKVVKGRLAPVPTPWGWPGHDDTKQSLGHLHGEGVSGSFHKWVDLLVSEKQTVDDQVYQSRKNASIRALLEDRYASGVGAGLVDKGKTKASLLSDPRYPHEERDSYPSGYAGPIVDWHELQPGKCELERKLSASGSSRVSLKEVRTPWGW